MKKIFRILFLSALLLEGIHARAQEKQSSGSSEADMRGRCVPVISLAEDSLAYQAGEHLKFTVHYSWGVINSDVGVATVDLDTLRINGEKVFHCAVYGKTVSWYDLLFKVREDFQAWFSADGIVPLKFTRNTREGRYRAKNTYTYMWGFHIQFGAEICPAPSRPLYL